MKHLVLAAALGLLLFSCNKETEMSNGTHKNQQTNLLDLQIKLKDSLSESDFASLDFSNTLVSPIDSLHVRFTRISLTGKPFATNFFIVKSDDSGRVLAGRFVSIIKDSSQPAAFTGKITYRAMRGGYIENLALVKGNINKTSVGTAEQPVAEEPVMDGGDLPPVIVSASYGSAGISYADWYNLEDMAGSDGYGYTGYYSPSAGGGGGNGTAAVEEVDFEAPESKDAIDVAKYMKCFGATQEAGATYTVTIAVDIPVDNDPSKIFSWSNQSPGHTFIELYKNGPGGLVQQEIGFYPDMPWKTVAGGDVSAKVTDDAGHEYQAKYTISVTAGQFAAAINAAQSYSSYDYNVATFNCADYALKVFTAAGGQLNVPQFPVPEYSDASNTPQGVYDAIQNLVQAGNPNAMANEKKQWIGASHGACD